VVGLETGSDSFIIIQNDEKNDGTRAELNKILQRNADQDGSQDGRNSKGNGRNESLSDKTEACQEPGRTEIRTGQ
jgi:hypothetical protein